MNIHIVPPPKPNIMNQTGINLMAFVFWIQCSTYWAPKITTEWQPSTPSLSLQLYRINQDKSKPQNIYKTTIKDGLLKFGSK